MPRLNPFLREHVIIRPERMFMDFISYCFE